jgi:CspA family cold shock protein
MAVGTVKSFEESRGSGYLTPDGGGRDLVAHFSEINKAGDRTLQSGERVQFDIAVGARGPEATNVRPA